jgi:hypothetical protein
VHYQLAGEALRAWAAEHGIDHENQVEDLGMRITYFSSSWPVTATSAPYCDFAAPFRTRR